MNGKGRRVASTAVTGSSLRDVVTAGQNGTVAGVSGTANSESSPGVSFFLPSDSSENMITDDLCATDRMADYRSFHPSRLPL